MPISFPPLSLALTAIVAGAFFALATEAEAAPPLDIDISIKDHKFAPATLNVPSGVEIKLTVKNLDTTPEEVESYPLGFEKVIPGNQTAVIRVRPLDLGTYTFFGEYHQDTAQGELVAE